MTKIQYAGLYRIEKGLYTLDAKLSDGSWVYHEGPRNYAYFTKAEAEALLARVRCAMQINLKHWSNGSDPYKDLRQMEDEYYDNMIGA
jgi:hypothetical protein